MQGPISIDNIDVNKIVVSKNIYIGNDFEYFIGYKKKLHTFAYSFQNSVYRRDFDKIKCMSLLIKDEKLLEQYNEILKKSATLPKKI